MDELYRKDLLRLAAEATGNGRLPSPTATVTVDNPLCGDRVTFDVAVDDGRVAAAAHTVRGCVLCQASASVLGTHATGAAAAGLREVRESVRGLLAGRADAQPWPELAAFEPVAAHKSRHRCVLLPFDAAIEAAELSARDEPNRN